MDCSALRLPAAVKPTKYLPYLSRDMIGAEYRFFGGPLICVKAGYKHVFIAVTDRLLMGVKDALLTVSPLEPNNSTRFVAANAVGVGIQVRF